MRRTMKRWLSLILATMMVLGSLPVSVYADETAVELPSVTTQVPVSATEPPPAIAEAPAAPENPSAQETAAVTALPSVSAAPEETPTVAPATVPTGEPTVEPTTVPTAEPTVAPTTDPTAEPAVEPTAEPTAEPTVEPTTEPTAEPTVEPTAEPTAEPTVEPTAAPTAEPTVDPTTDPTAEPTGDPTTEPTVEPTESLPPVPTVEPTAEPSPDQTTAPEEESTVAPTTEPTESLPLEPTETPEASATEAPADSVEAQDRANGATMHLDTFNGIAYVQEDCDLDYVVDILRYMDQQGQIKRIQVNAGVTLSDPKGSTLSLPVDNYGTISGGNYSQKVTNFGTVSGGTFAVINNEGTISGGTIGAISNNGQVLGGTIGKINANNGSIAAGTILTYTADDKSLVGTVGTPAVDLLNTLGKDVYWCCRMGSEAADTDPFVTNDFLLNADQTVFYSLPKATLNMQIMSLDYVEITYDHPREEMTIMLSLLDSDKNQIGNTINFASVVDRFSCVHALCGNQFGLSTEQLTSNKTFWLRAEGQASTGTVTNEIKLDIGDVLLDVKRSVVQYQAVSWYNLLNDYILNTPDHSVWHVEMNTGSGWVRSDAPQADLGRMDVEYRVVLTGYPDVTDTFMMLSKDAILLRVDNGTGMDVKERVTAAYGTQLRFQAKRFSMQGEERELANSENIRYILRTQDGQERVIEKLGSEIVTVEALQNGEVYAEQIEYYEENGEQKERKVGYDSNRVRWNIRPRSAKFTLTSGLVEVAGGTDVQSAVDAYLLANLRSGDLAGDDVLTGVTWSLDREVTAPGDYTVNVTAVTIGDPTTGDVTQNYNVELSATCTLRVKSVDLRDYFRFTIVSPAEVVYEGPEQTKFSYQWHLKDPANPLPWPLLDAFDITVTHEGQPCTDYRMEQADDTWTVYLNEAGDYSLKITPKAAYVPYVTQLPALETGVAKRSMTLLVEDVTLTNYTDPSQLVTNVQNPTDLIEGHSLHCTYFVGRPMTAADAGVFNSPVQIETVAVLDAQNNDVTANYSIDFTDGATITYPARYVDYQVTGDSLVAGDPQTQKTILFGLKRRDTDEPVPFDLSKTSAVVTISGEQKTLSLTPEADGMHCSVTLTGDMFADPNEQDSVKLVVAYELVQRSETLEVDIPIEVMSAGVPEQAIMQMLIVAQNFEKVVAVSMTTPDGQPVTTGTVTFWLDGQQVPDATVEVQDDLFVWTNAWQFLLENRNYAVRAVYTGAQGSTCEQEIQVQPLPVSLDDTLEILADSYDLLVKGTPAQDNLYNGLGGDPAAAMTVRAKAGAEDFWAKRSLNEILDITYTLDGAAITDSLQTPMAADGSAQYGYVPGTYTVTAAVREPYGALYTLNQPAASYTVAKRPLEVWAMDETIPVGGALKNLWRSDNNCGVGDAVTDVVIQLEDGADLNVPGEHALSVTGVTIKANAAANGMGDQVDHVDVTNCYDIGMNLHEATLFVQPIEPVLELIVEENDFEKFVIAEIQNAYGVAMSEGKVEFYLDGVYMEEGTWWATKPTALQYDWNNSWQYMLEDRDYTIRAVYTHPNGMSCEDEILMRPKKVKLDQTLKVLTGNYLDMAGESGSSLVYEGFAKINGVVAIAVNYGRAGSSDKSEFWERRIAHVNKTFEDYISVTFSHNDVPVSNSAETLIEGTTLLGFRAGSYKVNLAVKEPYQEIYSFDQSEWKVVLQRRSLAFTPNNVTIKAGETPEFTYVQSGGLAEGDSVTQLTFGVEDGVDVTVPGQYGIVLKSITIMADTDTLMGTHITTDVTDCYHIKVMPATLTVLGDEPAMQLSEYDGSRIYATVLLPNGLADTTGSVQVYVDDQLLENVEFNAEPVVGEFRWYTAWKHFLEDREYNLRVVHTSDSGVQTSASTTLRPDIIDMNGTTNVVAANATLLTGGVPSEVYDGFAGIEAAIMMNVYPRGQDSSISGFWSDQCRRVFDDVIGYTYHYNGEPIVPSSEFPLLQGEGLQMGFRAGEYTVETWVKEPYAGVYYFSEPTKSITIKKRPLTITPHDVTVERRQNPDFTWDETVELAQGDTITTLTLGLADDVDLNVAGTYPIILKDIVITADTDTMLGGHVTADVTDCYDITLAEAYVTVKETESPYYVSVGGLGATEQEFGSTDMPAAQLIAVVQRDSNPITGTLCVYLNGVLQGEPMTVQTGYEGLFQPTWEMYDHVGDYVISAVFTPDNGMPVVSDELTVTIIPFDLDSRNYVQCDLADDMTYEGLYQRKMYVEAHEPTPVQAFLAPKEFYNITVTRDGNPYTISEINNPAELGHLIAYDFYQAGDWSVTVELSEAAKRFAVMAPKTFNATVLKRQVQVYAEDQTIDVGTAYVPKGVVDELGFMDEIQSFEAELPEGTDLNVAGTYLQTVKAVQIVSTWNGHMADVTDCYDLVPTGEHYLTVLSMTAELRADVNESPELGVGSLEWYVRAFDIRSESYGALLNVGTVQFYDGTGAPIGEPVTPTPGYARFYCPDLSGYVTEVGTSYTFKAVYTHPSGSTAEKEITITPVLPKLTDRLTFAGWGTTVYNGADGIENPLTLTLKEDAAFWQKFPFDDVVEVAYLYNGSEDVPALSQQYAKEPNQVAWRPVVPGIYTIQLEIKPEYKDQLAYNEMFLSGEVRVDPKVITIGAETTATPVGEKIVIKPVVETLAASDELVSLQWDIAAEAATTPGAYNVTLRDAKIELTKDGTTYDATPYYDITYLPATHIVTSADTTRYIALNIKEQEVDSVSDSGVSAMVFDSASNAKVSDALVQFYVNGEPYGEPVAADENGKYLFPSGEALVGRATPYTLTAAEVDAKGAVVARSNEVELTIKRPMLTVRMFQTSGEYGSRKGSLRARFDLSEKPFADGYTLEDVITFTLLKDDQPYTLTEADEVIWKENELEVKLFDFGEYEIKLGIKDDFAEYYQVDGTKSVKVRRTLLVVQPAATSILVGATMPEISANALTTLVNKDKVTSAQVFLKDHAEADVPGLAAGEYVTDVTGVVVTDENGVDVTYKYNVYLEIGQLFILDKAYTLNVSAKEEILIHEGNTLGLQVMDGDTLVTEGEVTFVLENFGGSETVQFDPESGMFKLELPAMSFFAADEPYVFSVQYKGPNDVGPTILNDAIRFYVRPYKLSDIIRFTVTDDFVYDGTTKGTFTIDKLDPNAPVWQYITESVGDVVMPVLTINGEPVKMDALLEMVELTDTGFKVSVTDIGTYKMELKPWEESLYSYFDYDLAPLTLSIRAKPLDPTFVITIPATAPIDGNSDTGTLTLAASDVQHLNGKYIQVTVTSENAFSLTGPMGSVPYILSNATGTIAQNGEAAVFMADGTADLTMTAQPDAPNAGNYTDTLTFTVQLCDEGQ